MFRIVTSGDQRLINFLPMNSPPAPPRAGNVLWALGDNLGTIRDIADLSGSTTSVTNHRRFGAFGNLVSESNATVDMVFAFTGKLYDENTKLQNNLNRWYEAATGQWMSEDPIGFAAGDENTRRYVAIWYLNALIPLDYRILSHFRNFVIRCTTHYFAD